MVSRESHAVPLHHRITASVNGPKATSRVPGYLPPHSFYEARVPGYPATFFLCKVYLSVAQRPQEPPSGEPSRLERNMRSF